MGSLGPEKILLIVLVLLLLFGARRLPELGASLGKSIREFKGSVREVAKPQRDDEAHRPSDTAAETPAPRRLT